MADLTSLRKRPSKHDGSIDLEMITVRVTETRQTMDVAVLNKRSDLIQVIVHDGTHSVFCELVPTPGALAFVGNAMGLEVVYERSPAEVQADIDRESLAQDNPGRR